MNIPTTAELPFSATGASTRTLPHDLVPLDSTQRRLMNRVKLVPVVDIEDFRFRAVVDWIEFRVHLGRTTQAQHVQQILRRHLPRDSFIRPEDEGPGSTFSICSIRVQEPANLALIARVHRDLTGTFGEAAGSRVAAIEISVDATPRQPSDNMRTTLLGAMQRTIWTGRDIWSNPSSRPRTFGGNRQMERLIPPPREEALEKRLKRDNEVPSALVPGHHRAPFVDGTMYLGARDGDDVMIRIMDKVKDRQRPDGTFDDLPGDQKRVRIEATLKGIELLTLGITDVPSLRRTKLASMKKRYFQFRLPSFSSDDSSRGAANVMRNAKQVWRARTYLRTGIVGLMAMDREAAELRKTMLPGLRRTMRAQKQVKQRTWVGKRLEPSFVSWEEMNRKVDVAFRQLVKREQTAWKRMKP